MLLRPSARSAILAFISRHRWSLPLSLGALAFFARLATELRENKLGPFDAAVAAALTRSRGNFDGSMLWLTHLGQGESLFVVVLSSGMLLIAAKRRREAVFLAAVGSGALALDALLKIVFHRGRPDAAQLYLIHAPRSFSFPSGHALASASILLGLVVVARVMGVRGVYLAPLTAGALALVLGIAASRVYFGVHYPSDVIGGLLAGAGWLSTVTGWFYPRVLPGEEVPPLASAEPPVAP